MAIRLVKKLVVRHTPSVGWLDDNDDDDLMMMMPM